MKIENNLNNKTNINNNLEKEQKNFLETTIGKMVNTALDVGIRKLLPTFVEDQVINLKDNLLNYGMKEGIQKTIDDTLEIGKGALGIVTGKFDNIQQMQNVVQTGGLLDGISDLFDVAIKTIKQKGLIDSNISKILTQGKNVILNNVENNIEKMFTNQINSSSKLEKYIQNWQQDFENKDFNSMEKEYKKIQNEIKILMPIEKTINKARTIENLHNLIKNNGQNFNLTAGELELAQKLK